MAIFQDYQERKQAILTIGEAFFGSVASFKSTIR